MNTSELVFKYGGFQFLIVQLYEVICYEYFDENINKMDKKYVIYRRFLNCTTYTSFCITYVYIVDNRPQEVSLSLYTEVEDMAPGTDRWPSHWHTYTADSCPRGEQRSGRLWHADPQTHSLKTNINKTVFSEKTDVPHHPYGGP